MGLTFEVRGLESAHGMIRALPGTTESAAWRMVDRAGSVVSRFWKLRLSGPASAKTLGVRTGNLRASIRQERVGKAAVVVGSHLPYSAIHEFGGKTRPHVIRPKHGKALRFMGKGGLRFASFVNHPGSLIPPRPHRGPALEDASRPLDLIFSGEMDKAIAEADRISGMVNADSKAALASILAAGGTGRRG